MQSGSQEHKKKQSNKIHQGREALSTSHWLDAPRNLSFSFLGRNTPFKQGCPQRISNHLFQGWGKGGRNLYSMTACCYLYKQCTERQPALYHSSPNQYLVLSWTYKSEIVQGTKAVSKASLLAL